MLAVVLGAQLTPSNWSPSSRWRGITVTISISHRNAVSGGVRPEGSGKAMVRYSTWGQIVALDMKM